MRHFNSRLLMLVPAVSLAASVALGQPAPQPVITSVQGSYVSTPSSPLATSVTAGVTNLLLTITGTDFDLSEQPPVSKLVWVPSAGGCPVASCVFTVTPVSLTQFTASSTTLDALIANADPGAAVVVRNSGFNDSAPFPFPVNPKVTDAAMPQAYLNVPYSAYITSGGTPVYTVNPPITGGVPGLSASGSALGGGKITGAPTLLGTFSGTAKVLDAWGQTAPSNAYTVNVATLPGAVLGVFYSVQSSFVGVGPYICTVTSGSFPPGINIFLSNGSDGSGELTISGKPTATGAYTAFVEVDAPYGVTVATGSISINVMPPPVIGIAPPTLGGMPTTGFFAVLLSAQGGTAPYTWSVSSGALPAGLTLNSSTGEISGTPTGKGSSFTIKVTDHTGLTSTRAYTLDYLLQLSPATLPAGQVGTNYLPNLSVTGGSGSYICSLYQGSLPPPLSLSAQCGLTGTPTKVGSFPFTIQVADLGDGQILTQPYTVVINPPTLTITTASPLPNTPMGAISIPLAAAGGTPPYKWSVTAGSLPSGASLSTAGVVTGAATAQGAFTFTATVTDSVNATASKSFTLTIVPALLTITTGALPGGFGQTAYSATISATGGVPPYKWSASGLPSALTINPATGIISGTPGPQGTFAFTVTVTDSVGGTNTQTFTITVTIGTLKITSVALPSARATVFYTTQLTASGGVLPYTWSPVGQIPAGFVVLSNGTICGTDPRAEVLSFPVRVLDGQGDTADALVGLTVTPAPLLITTTTMPGGTAGMAYSQSLSATGGTPPFTWTAALPSGLTINPNTGVISGASLVGGPQTLVVTVTDVTGAFTSYTYSVTFAMPPLSAVIFVPVTAVSAAQPNLGFSLASPYPLAISGTASIALNPNGSVGDPAVVFASGNTTLPFTIAAGAVSPTFSAGANGFQTGTVSGTIVITLSIQSGGVDITPSPAPSLQIRIAPQAPVITSVTATRNVAVLTVAVQGYSNTREVDQASFQLGVTLGANVTPTSFTVPVSTVFASYFQSSAAASAGGRFLYTQTFTVAGDIIMIQSVTVSLTNSVGVSASVTAQAQ
jgi:hypothetical protein